MAGEYANRTMGSSAGVWIGLLGVIVAVVSFFWLHTLLGIVAVILGIVVLFTPQKPLGWISLVLGVISLLIFSL